MNAVLKSIGVAQGDPNAAVLNIEVSNGTEVARRLKITPLVRGLGSSDQLDWLTAFQINSKDGRCEAWSGPGGTQGVTVSAKTERIVRCEISARVSTAKALLPAAELRFMISYDLVSLEEAL